MKAKQEEVGHKGLEEDASGGDASGEEQNVVTNQGSGHAGEEVSQQSLPAPHAWTWIQIAITLPTII